MSGRNDAGVGIIGDRGGAVEGEFSKGIGCSVKLDPGLLPGIGLFPDVVGDPEESFETADFGTGLKGSLRQQSRTTILA